MSKYRPRYRKANRVPVTCGGGTFTCGEPAEWTVIGTGVRSVCSDHVEAAREEMGEGAEVYRAP